MEAFEHGGNVWAHLGAIDFSASLNPLGMPPAARAALAAGIDACMRYPDPACTALTAAIADAWGVAAAHVLACAGATDALGRIAQVLRPRQVLLPTPAYVGYAEAFARFGTEVSSFALDEADDFALTGAFVEAVRKTEADLVLVANPNNPTGRLVAPDLIEEVLDVAAARALTVVVDECFCGLTGAAGSATLLEAHPNLVLVGALTKSHALAGLRVGHLMCADASLLNRLRAAGPPWAVSVPAQLAGVAALADKGFLAASVEAIARQRERLVQGLSRLGVRVIPSDANFVLFRTRPGLAADLAERDILIRCCANFAGLDETWYRAAVRTEQENDLLLEAIGEVL